MSPAPSSPAPGMAATRCPDCEDREWLHMTSMQDGPEVQRCDACRRYPSDDAALDAHELQCGCLWGAEDVPYGEPGDP